MGSPRFALLEHAVEGVEALPHVGQLLGIGIGQGLGHLLEEGLGHLLAQLLHQLLEVLPGLGGDEVVVLEARTVPARSLGSRSSAMRRSVATSSVTSWRRSSPEAWASASEFFDGGALFGQDLLELLGELAMAPPGSPRSSSPPAPAQLVQQVPQPLDLLAVGRARAPVEHPPQRVVEVAVGQEVVGELGQERVGVVDQRILGPVPPSVVVVARSSRGPR